MYVCTVLVRNDERKRPLRRPKRRWDDDIKTGGKAIFWNIVKWIKLTVAKEEWQALVNTLIQIRVP
jgi:hypothetical protein